MKHDVYECILREFLRRMRTYINLRRCSRGWPAPRCGGNMHVGNLERLCHVGRGMPLRKAWETQILCAPFLFLVLQSCPDSFGGHQINTKPGTSHLSCLANHCPSVPAALDILRSRYSKRFAAGISNTGLRGFL